MRLTFLALALALSTTSPALADWKTIQSKADLQKIVVGKSWVNPKNKSWFRLRRNGKLAGAAGKDELAGAWA